MMQIQDDPFGGKEIYEYKKIPWLNSFKADFRLLDLYALPVSLRYKGQKKFYTNYGACTSLCVILAVLGYIYSQIMLMLSYTQYTMTQTSSSII